MADLKISQLTSATTPLAGTEVVPLVQSSATKKVSIADLTAGRNVSASGLFIDANSATNAVRITQTGTGNALLVEDSANPDISPFVINASGQVIVGAATPFAASTITPGINFQGVSGTNAANAIGLNAFSADASGPVLYFGKTRSATVGSAALVSDGDFLGALFFEGSDGTSQKRGASIVAQVDGATGTNDMPGRLVFNTTADGAGSVTERMRITQAGNVGIGTNGPNASAILDVQSTTKGVRMPNMTTAEKNAIVTPAAGLMVFDTTLAKLCVYSGAAWQTITSV